MWGRSRSGVRVALGVGPVRRRRERWVAALLGSALTVGLVPMASGTALAEPPQADAAPRQSASEPGVPEGDGAVGADQAIAEAMRTGKRVEVTSMRGESRDVFAMPEGHLEAREYLRPVRTRLDGKWADVDTDLAVSSAGVRPKVAVTEMTFSGGGDQPLVRMVRSGRELALSWPGALPKPEVAGDTATYREVLPGVDLRMGAQVDGFTQLLVVKNAEAAQSEKLKSLSLKLAAEGMAVRETDQGGLEAIDNGAGSAVFEAPTPQMWDSSNAEGGEGAAPMAARTGAAARMATGADGETGASESNKLAPVGVEVPADGKELILTPDQDVLRGEDTQYPVFIDPQWYSPRATSWTMASKYWESSPQWKFNGDPDAGMGLCNWNYCKPNDTKRLFYQIPVSKFAGKSILSAEFVVRNTWSASCDARSVELWQTKGISSSTTWKSQNASGFWVKELKAASFAYGYTGCAAKDAEFDVKAAVQSAANSKLPSMTFGLRAGSESDGKAWKRFSDQAYLRVKYNRPPPQVKASQLSMEYGGVCKTSAKAARVRTLGMIYADNVTDPDGDSVAVEFKAAWDTGDGKGNTPRWNPARTPSKKSGKSFAVSLPTSIPQSKPINWYVRVWDGSQYSPWSYAGDPAACYFIYDSDAPKAPVITSGEYPALDPADPEDAWYDGVGKYGSFSFKAADTDVTSYWYGINTDPTSAHKITTSAGAAKVLQMLPSKPGLNYVMAQTFDASGNGSEISTYRFRVRAGQPDRATWQLDEPAGATEANGSTPERVLNVHGGVSSGGEGAIGTATHFNGTDGYAYSELPAVDTSLGFAVSAWVKLDKVPSEAAIIASQTGNNRPGFELYYSSSLDRWVFNQFAEDKAGSSIVRAMSDKAGDAKSGVWTHLAGSYDGVADKLALYVNGKLAGETHYSTPWEARRGFQLGAGSYTGGVRSSFFPGSIDEVQVFDKPLAADEVSVLYTKKDVGDPGRPAVADFPLDEKEEATTIVGHGQVFPAKYNGGVTTGVEGVTGKAAHFNGTSGYARIAQSRGPHVNTSRSFTVSAWAKLDKKPGTAAVIAAQAGAFSPGFELYYSSASDRWAFNQYSADTADAKVIRAVQPEGTTARTGEWVHLLGVHDTVANTLTLYVNGAKAGSTTLEGAFYADQSMYLGAGSYSGKVGNFFPGTVDDVRLYDRVVSPEEVTQMTRQHPLLKGRWMFDGQSTTTPATSPDESAEGRAMTLKGGAALGSGMIGSNGLDLNGTDAYAATPAMPLDTSASFSITAWARAAATPTQQATVLSTEGASRNALDLRFVPDDKDPAGQGRWELALADKDSTKATIADVSSTEFYDVEEWNHLAVVYDGVSKEASLYVNGNLQVAPCRDDDGDGKVDEAGCLDLIAWGENILTHKATRTFQVGAATTAGKAGQYFPGTVDDVWAFQGALNASQVEQLASALSGLPTEVPQGS